MPASSVLAPAAVAMAAAAVLCGCDDDAADHPTVGEPRAAQREPGPPPDAGVAAGHGADRASVIVPDAERDPPRATIVLAAAGGDTLARVSQPGRARPGVVRLGEPRLRATTIGDDANEGMARVRVSISERIACRGTGGRRFTRPRIRYFPPPQVERIRSTPGTRLPVRDERSLVIRVGGGHCGAAATETGVRGELWGEAINGSGLEAVTPHIHFGFVPR